LFEPAINDQQNEHIVMLERWFTPAEALKLVTHDNAKLLALSGLRSPYQGRLGVVAEDALADLLLVRGNPIEDLDLIGDPARNFVIIMKDGRIYKDIRAEQ
ncbi:MAG: amidohydrolase family protein, partial [Wenzhouxiangella sp.]